MALVREGLRGIISTTEDCLNEAGEVEKYRKYMARRDRSLATIVLAIDTSPFCSYWEILKILLRFGKNFQISFRSIHGQIG